MPESSKPIAARLTVTPANVGSLCANIRALAREGAKRIVYVADPDAAWDVIAVELWRREHERLVTWMVGARSAGQRLPELPAWRAIEARRARPAGYPLAKAAILAATVTGMAACRSNGPMNVKPDATSDTNQTRDVGIGGGICAMQIDRDAYAPADVLPPGKEDASDGGSPIDGDQTETADAYIRVGGIC